MSPTEQVIERALTAHETHWTLMAHTLRALDTDAEAAHYLRRHVRELMADALRAGYEGREPTPKRPGLNHHHKADEWIGMQLLRDIGPRGLSEVDWTTLGGRLTQFAGTRICERRDWAPVHTCVAPKDMPQLSRAPQLSMQVTA